MEPLMATIQMFGGNFAPRGWAFCDGQLLPINQNQALFSLLGTTYGGDGRTTFGLPDLRGAVAIGKGQRPGQSGNHPLGAKGGSETTTLFTQNLPAHSHGVFASSNGVNQPSAAGGFLPSNSGRQDPDLYASTQGTATPMGNAIGNTGNNTPFNNMQPYQTVSYIIALTGIFPSRS